MTFKLHLAVKASVNIRPHALQYIKQAEEELLWLGGVGLRTS